MSKKGHQKNFAYTFKTEVMTSKMGQFEHFLENLNPGSGHYTHVTWHNMNAMQQKRHKGVTWFALISM